MASSKSFLGHLKTLFGGTRVFSDMAIGPHANNSRFDICFNKVAPLDSRSVVFGSGKVTQGMDVAKNMEKAGSSSGCGQLP